MSPLNKDIVEHVQYGPPHPPIYNRRKLQAPDWREFLSGYLAGSINIFMTFPINKTMFRQQLHGISALEAVNQLKREGMISLYRGFLPPMLQKSFSYSLMFGCYEQYSRSLRDGLKFGVASSKVMAAILAGCTEALLTPFERVQTLMLDAKYGGQFKNTPHAFQSLRVYGIKEYYRGLSAILMRNGPSNVIFFSCRDKLRDSIPDHERLGLLADFVSGACLGALISTLSFPINTTKTHMQKMCGGKFHSFNAVFLALYRERGLWGMFRGVHVNYTRSFLSWGITNVAYEFLVNRIAR